MSIVKIKDKRNGVTYVYEQDKGEYDPKRKQTRTHRRLIGKVDPETGEIVPTKGWGKLRTKGPDADELKDWRKSLKEIRATVERLTQEVAELRVALAKSQAADGGIQ